MCKVRDNRNPQIWLHCLALNKICRLQPSVANPKTDRGHKKLISSILSRWHKSTTRHNFQGCTLVYSFQIPHVFWLHIIIFPIDLKALDAMWSLNPYRACVVRSMGPRSQIMWLQFTEYCHYRTHHGTYICSLFSLNQCAPSHVIDEFCISFTWHMPIYLSFSALEYDTGEIGMMMDSNLCVSLLFVFVFIIILRSRFREFFFMRSVRIMPFTGRHLQEMQSNFATHLYPWADHIDKSWVCIVLSLHPKAHYINSRTWEPKARDMRACFPPKRYEYKQMTGRSD